jgi:hypothetical protein
MIYSPDLFSHSAIQSSCRKSILCQLFWVIEFNYQSKFYGQMQADYKPRALIGTYQDLGMIKMMTIISPKQQVKQFKLTLLPKAGVEDDFQIYYDQKPLKPKE